MQQCLAGEGQKLEVALVFSSTDWFDADALPPVVVDWPRTFRDRGLTGTCLLNLARRKVDIAFSVFPSTPPTLFEGVMWTCLALKSAMPLRVKARESAAAFPRMICKNAIADLGP